MKVKALFFIDQSQYSISVRQKEKNFPALAQYLLWKMWTGIKNFSQL